MPMRTCPVVRNAPVTSRCTAASSRVASSSTTAGSLPPSSSVTRVRFLAAVVIMYWPAAEYTAADACAAELLCDRHPGDAVAFRVIEPDLSTTELTYGELGKRSQQLAAALAERGIKQGDAVGVLMAKSVDLPAVLLAIWRLGA